MAPSTVELSLVAASVLGWGWLLSLLVKPGVFPAADSTIGLPATGILFGGIVGVGLSALVVVFRAARDPKAGPPSYFMRLHGMGSTLIGRSDPRQDGSYVTTEWFTFSYIPIFPVCRYRVTEQQTTSLCFRHIYDSREASSSLPRLGPGLRDRIDSVGWVDTVLGADGFQEHSASMIGRSEMVLTLRCSQPPKPFR